MKTLIQVICFFKGLNFDFCELYMFPYRFTWKDKQGVERMMNTDKFNNAFKFAVNFK